MIYFLFSQTLENWGLTLKERICSTGSKFFPLKVAPHKEGGMPRLSLYKVHPFPLNKIKYSFCRLRKPILKVPDIPRPFQVFPDQPQNSLNFLCPQKNIHFQDVATPKDVHFDVTALELSDVNVYNMSN